MAASKTSVRGKVIAPLKLVVVDTNILFSALLRGKSRFAQIILSTERPFFICESTIVELFKYKEKIIRLSNLSETDVVRLFYILLRRVTIAKEELIERSIRQKASELCSSIDKADTPHVALTIQLNGLL